MGLRPCLPPLGLGREYCRYEVEERSNENHVFQDVTGAAKTCMARKHRSSTDCGQFSSMIVLGLTDVLQMFKSV